MANNTHPSKVDCQACGAPLKAPLCQQCSDRLTTKAVRQFAPGKKKAEIELDPNL